MSWSQHDEEEVVIRELASRPPGRFLDVGAHDGCSNSNTLALMGRGWRGVMVEPSPGPFTSLLTRHAADPLLDAAVLAAVSPTSGILPFHDSAGDQLSTLSVAHRVFWDHAAVPWRTFLVPAITPTQLLASVGFDFGFLSLDVEGMNHPVAAAFPWGSLTRLRLTCVEHEGRPDLVDELLAPYGFRRLHLTPENVLHSREIPE